MSDTHIMMLAFFGGFFFGACILIGALIGIRSAIKKWEKEND